MQLGNHTDNDYLLASLKDICMMVCY